MLLYFFAPWCGHCRSERAGMPMLDMCHSIPRPLPNGIAAWGLLRGSLGYGWHVPLRPHSTRVQWSTLIVRPVRSGLN
jgi:hypothetical protein